MRLLLWGFEKWKSENFWNVDINSKRNLEKPSIPSSLEFITNRASDLGNDRQAKLKPEISMTKAKTRLM
jgi:hypothetical protein